MKILFSNNITEIRVYEKARHYSDLVFGTGKRKIGTKWGIFPIYEKIEGLFYHWSNDYWGTVEEYNTQIDTFYEDGLFYKKPCCEIHLCSGQLHTKYFETVEELHKYVDKIKWNSPHIILK
jgi:hypothetical protein